MLFLGKMRRGLRLRRVMNSLRSCEKKFRCAGVRLSVQPPLYQNLDDMVLARSHLRGQFYTEQDMAFPTDWIQVWTTLPFEHGTKIELTPTWLQWFRPDPGIPTPFPTFAFLNNLNAWLVSVCGIVCATSPLFGPQDLTYNVFWNSTLHIGGLGFSTLFQMPQAEILPSTCNVLFRQFTATSGPRGVGRKAICGLPRAYSNGDTLNVFGKAFADAAAINMATPFVADGVTYRPAVVSYADSTLMDITAVVASGRLSRVKRRGRNYLPFGGFFPKPPPP